MLLEVSAVACPVLVKSARHGAAVESTLAASYMSTLSGCSPSRLSYPR